MADQPSAPRVRPILRWLAALACGACLATSVAVFPLAGLAERPQALIFQVVCVVVSIFLGAIAATGRTIRWPWEGGGGADGTEPRHPADRSRDNS